MLPLSGPPTICWSQEETIPPPHPWGLVHRRPSANAGRPKGGLLTQSKGAGPTPAQVSGGVGGTSPRLGQGQSLHQRLRRGAGQDRRTHRVKLLARPPHPQFLA